MADCFSVIGSREDCCTVRCKSVAARSGPSLRLFEHRPCPPRGQVLLDPIRGQSETVRLRPIWSKSDITAIAVIHQKMRFGGVLLVLAGVASPVVAETIHGVTVFSRHGDRTSVLNRPCVPKTLFAAHLVITQRANMVLLPCIQEPQNTMPVIP